MIAQVSLFLVVVLIGLTTSACYSQAQRKENIERFPTYEEIRGNKKEINDFVVPSTLNTGYEPIVAKTVVLDKYWNAFNYLADSTVYYLNGKQAKSQKSAKKELNGQSLEIERVSIGAVGSNGKREIEIDYRVKPRKQVLN
jgi:hypothetical protein